jgi:hypothetical protein
VRLQFEQSRSASGGSCDSVPPDHLYEQAWAGIDGSLHSDRSVPVFLEQLLIEVV